MNTFDTGNRQTISDIDDSVYSPAVPLADGTWYWRVRAVDMAGNLGSFSDTGSVIIDTQAPSWDVTPSDQLLEFGADFRYSVSASDVNGVPSYQVNDTSRFGVLGNGTVFNLGLIPVGVYGLQVTATNAAHFTATATFTLTIEDTTEPVWIVAPESIAMEFGNPVQFNVSASDLSGIDHYTLGDPTNFAISVTGTITSITNYLRYLLAISSSVTLPTEGYLPFRNDVFVLIYPRYPIAESNIAING